jgi:hypothetical protein
MKPTLKEEQQPRASTHMQQQLAASQVASSALLLAITPPATNLGPLTQARQAVATAAVAQAYVEGSSTHLLSSLVAVAAAARQLLLGDRPLLAAAAQVGVHFAHLPTLYGDGALCNSSQQTC